MKCLLSEDSEMSCSSTGQIRLLTLSGLGGMVKQYCIGEARKCICHMKNTGRVMCFNLLSAKHHSISESAVFSSNVPSSKAKLRGNSIITSFKWNLHHIVVMLKKCAVSCSAGVFSIGVSYCIWETASMFYLNCSVTSQALARL